MINLHRSDSRIDCDTVIIGIGFTELRLTQAVRVTATEDDDYTGDSTATVTLTADRLRDGNGDGRDYR